MAIASRNYQEPLNLDFLKPKNSNFAFGTVQHCFYKFIVGTEIQFAEDIDVHAIKELVSWTMTPAGSWCVINATDLKMHVQLDVSTLQYAVAVTGKLSPKNSTFWLLKFA